MRVLQINSVVNKGSTGRIAEAIGQAVINQGGESYIAYGRSSNYSSSNTYKIGNKLSIYQHVLGTRISDRHGFFSSLSTRKLIRYIKKIKPDIIHLHNIHGYYLNIEILFNYLSKINIPIVWTLHDCWSFTGHCAHYSAANCYRWKNKCFGCPQKNTYPTSWVVDNSKENFENKKRLFTSVKNMIIVPVSNWLESEVRQSFLGKYTTQIIYNGIDLSVFKRKAQPYLKSPKFILLGLATTWSVRKGLDDFIKLSRFLDKDELIVLVGVSKAQLEKLPENVVGIERTENQSQLAQLYSQAGIVLSLSVEETFGLTLVEGFACGTPAIVYNSTATPELITEETGRVVKPHDIKGVRKAIDEIRASKIDFTKACRQRAELLYNKDDRYKDYIDLYKEILNKQ